MSEERQTYKVKEAAKILGVGVNTLYIAIREGRFPAIRIGRVVRISKAALDSALADGSIESRPHRDPAEYIGPPGHVNAESWSERTARELEIRTKLAGGELY